jgi:hypothetical protein
MAGESLRVSSAKFVWYFGDGNDVNENCDHKDEGEFDGITRYTYTSDLRSANGRL